MLKYILWIMVTVMKKKWNALASFVLVHYDFSNSFTNETRLHCCLAEDVFDTANAFLSAAHGGHIFCWGNDSVDESRHCSKDLNNNNMKTLVTFMSFRLLYLIFSINDIPDNQLHGPIAFD